MSLDDVTRGNFKIYEIIPPDYSLLEQLWVITLCELETTIEVHFDPAPDVLQIIRHHSTMLSEPRIHGEIIPFLNFSITMNSIHLSLPSLCGSLRLLMSLFCVFCGFGIGDGEGLGDSSPINRRPSFVLGSRRWWWGSLGARTHTQKKLLNDDCQGRNPPTPLFF